MTKKETSRRQMCSKFAIQLEALGNEFAEEYDLTYADLVAEVMMYVYALCGEARRHEFIQLERGWLSSHSDQRNELAIRLKELGDSFLKTLDIGDIIAGLFMYSHILCNLAIGNRVEEVS